MNSQSVDTALVVEGGALRGVFSTGLLDGFLEAKFNPFDLCIGVSSGASNLAAYLAGMIGRNARIYMEYSLRPDFISFSKYFRGGHLLDLDWLWEVTIREIRLDLGTIYSRGKPFLVVMTDVRTGEAVYRLTGAGDLEQVLKASSAMPLLYRGYPTVGGRPMMDGGVADALPVGEAIRRGARRIMIVRSRPRGYRKHAGAAEWVMRWHVRQYLLLRQAMATRIRRYNETVALIRKPPDGVSIVEICPPGNFRVSRLSKDRLMLQEGYEQGRSLAGEAMALWKRASEAPAVS